MNPYEENMVFCPFDSNHQINSCKLQMHIVRCQKNHPNAKIKLCPYNSRHYVKLAEFKDHVENCPSRKIDPWNYQQEEIQSLDLLPIESGLRIPGDYSNKQEHHQAVDILPIESALRIPGGAGWNNEPEVSSSQQRRKKNFNSQAEINSKQNLAKTVPLKKTENATNSKKVEPNTSSNISQALINHVCDEKKELTEELIRTRHNNHAAAISSPSNKNAVPFSYAKALKKSSTDSTWTGKENVQEKPNSSSSEIQQLSEKVCRLNVNDGYRKNKKH